MPDPTHQSVHGQEAYENRIASWQRRGYVVSTRTDMRCVLVKSGGLGHPGWHILALFLFPIIGNLIVMAFALAGGNTLTLTRTDRPEPSGGSMKNTGAYSKDGGWSG